MIFKQEDIILCESYRWLCDYIYGAGFTSPKVVPPQGVVCVALDEICDFFKLIEGRPERYVVVSPRSDYGLFYQKDEPVYADVLKIAKYLITSQVGYRNIHLPTRCDKDKCNINHTFSIKMHTWTKETFHKIPGNIIHWFVTNNGIIDNPIIESIPFGIGGDKKEDQEKFSNLELPIKRIDKLYIAFGDSTNERLELRSWYKERKFDWAIIKENISKEEYLKDLLTYKYVLCPNGNGVDCYRTWECIYTGAIPIVKYNNVTKQFINDLPIAYTDDLKFESYEDVEISFRRQRNKGHLLATLSYWKKRISEERKKLI